MNSAESDALTKAHEDGYEAGYAQACEDFGRTSAAVAADALREAAAALGIGPKMRVLVERESCDWWTDRPVALWLRERADDQISPPATTDGGA